MVFFLFQVSLFQLTFFAHEQQTQPEITDSGISKKILISGDWENYCCCLQLSKELLFMQ